MKYILTYLLIFISTHGITQITLEGVENAEIKSEIKNNKKAKNFNLKITGSEEEILSSSYIPKKLKSNYKDIVGKTKVVVTIVDYEKNKSNQEEKVSPEFKAEKINKESDLPRKIKITESNFTDTGISKDKELLATKVDSKQENLNKIQTLNNSGIYIKDENLIKPEIDKASKEIITKTKVFNSNKTNDVLTPKNNYSVEELNYGFGLIIFDENSFKVNECFYSTLYNIARYIHSNPDKKIEVTGYIDISADEQFNLNLSEKRSNEVYNILTQVFKVSPNNLKTISNTKSDSIVEDFSAQRNSNLDSKYFMSRRVELNIIK